MTFDPISYDLGKKCLKKPDTRKDIIDLFNTPFWDKIPDKPFTTLGSEFSVSNGELHINSSDSTMEDISLSTYSQIGLSSEKIYLNGHKILKFVGFGKNRSGTGFNSNATCIVKVLGWYDDSNSDIIVEGTTGNTSYTKLFDEACYVEGYNWITIEVSTGYFGTWADGIVKII